MPAKTSQGNQARFPQAKKSINDRDSPLTPNTESFGTRPEAVQGQLKGSWNKEIVMQDTYML